MIKDDFLIKTAQGYYCKYGDFFLDPQLPVKKAVISHAHGDHAKPESQLVFCTSFTQQVMQLRYKKKAATTFDTKQYGAHFYLGDVKLSFIPAGHILGSAMVKMEYLDITYLFTGDFKLQKDNSCEAFAFCKADVLITETTFAKPENRHPNPEKEIEKLNNITTNILLGAYGLGKAQRLTKMINEICPQKTVHLHYSIFPVHQLYLNNGVDLGPFIHYDRKKFKQNPRNQVYIVPPLTFNSYHKAMGVVKLFASGWKNLQCGNDESLYISDHADWADILQTIKEVAPQQVWTIHGDGQQLKNYFKDLLTVKIL
ncbi:MAG TPA: exonuclease [Pelobium sp.]